MKRKYIFICSLIAFFVLSIFVTYLFVSSSVYESSSKKFWVDETYGYQATINESYKDLLIKGAKGQGSRAPLDYIIQKFFKTIRKKKETHILPPLVYYRLFPLTSVVIALWLALFYSGYYINKDSDDYIVKSVQFILLVGVVINYFCMLDVYHYSKEMRPYALWNSLYFISLVALVMRRKVALFISLSCLAMTATASAFQIFAIGLAYAACEFSQGKKNKEIFISGLKVFLVPSLISVYYCLMVKKCGYPVPAWSEFLDLWVKKCLKAIPYVSVAMIACWANKENRKKAYPLYAMILMYLLGPIIFMLTRKNQFFFSSRQYLYYDFMQSMSFLVFILCLPAFISKLKGKKRVALILIVFMCGALFTKTKHLKNYKRYYSNTRTILSDGLKYIPEKEMHK